MARLFGTDGVRGRANELLTAELALDLSVAAAHVLGEVGGFPGRRPTAMVGRDPRASGEFLEAAVVAGLASAGMDVVRLGVVPTPGVAHLVGNTRAELGVMISASHNPMPDNGIKFLARGGLKLDDALEDRIEARLREEWQRPTGAGVGRVRDAVAAVDAYVDHLVESVGDVRLEGFTVVADCAHGAACRTLPQALEALGARVITLHCAPDGLNINDQCGSTHPEALQAAVVAHSADLGVAMDGDADRCLAVDAAGRVVDGDQLMAILAIALKESGRLATNTLVATVMSNQGLEVAMAEHGIDLVRTRVGDRYVLDEMRENGHSLGGEQSGHVILADWARTGDGALTALHLLARMAETGRTLADLASVMTSLPQRLVNVRDVDKARVGSDEEVAEAVERVEGELGSAGRVLLRPSGTEPVVRVMVEAPSVELAERHAAELAGVVSARLAL